MRVIFLILFIFGLSVLSGCSRDNSGGFEDLRANLDVNKMREFARRIQDQSKIRQISISEKRDFITIVGFDDKILLEAAYSVEKSDFVDTFSKAWSKDQNEMARYWFNDLKGMGLYGFSLYDDKVEIGIYLAADVQLILVNPVAPQRIVDIYESYAVKGLDYRNDRWEKVSDRVYLKTERP